MNVVYQGLGLLLLVTGALSATVANLGETCAIGDTCSVNAAVCDMYSLTCQCQFGYVQSGTICSRHHLGLCGAGMCKSPQAMTCDAATNQCKCDTVKGYVVAGTGCGCPASQRFNSDVDKCQKAIGQTCAGDSDCYTTDGMVCASGTCACNTAQHYGAGSSGAYTCSCNSATFFGPKSGGGCIGNVGAACTGDSDCRTDQGMRCTSNVCECNTDLHYAAGTDGAATCTCDSTNKFGPATGGGCIGNVGAACNANSDCRTDQGMVCSSNLCECDTNVYAGAGTANAATCACDASAHEGFVPGGGCTGNVGFVCTSDNECRTDVGMVCSNGACACNTALHYGAGIDDDSTCTCNSGTYFADKTGGGCIGNVGAACSGDSDCRTDEGMVCSSGACACNTALHYATGSSGAATCTCNSATYFADKPNGGCIGKVGAACSAATDCLTGLVCTSSKCACDTTLHYTAGSNGATSCTCNSAAFFGQTSGGCTGNVGATCSADSDCRTDAGMVCTSGKCACDTTKNFLTGSNGAAFCSCATGFTASSFYGTCAINVGQPCTRDAGIFVPCVDNAVCDRETDTCKCDSAAGYLATGTTCGSCKSGYTRDNGRCVADVNGFCIPGDQAGVCVGGATCFAGNSTLDPLCLCDSNQYDYKLSCSGAGGVVASLAGLLMALFMTSRLM